MEDPAKPMEFKDCLRQLIEDNGGMSRDNLEWCIGEMRKIKPDFSVQRLQNLLRGYPPSYDDRLAVSHALEPESDRWMADFWPLEDRQSRDLARLALRKYRSHELAREFVEYVQEHARFRDGELTEIEGFAR